MKKKIRYQSNVDLKDLRKIYKLSKEDVAKEIGYSIRTVERIESENAVIDVNAGIKLCDLYNLDFEKNFYEIDLDEYNFLKEGLANYGEEPKNVIDDNSKYFYLFVRKKSLFRDCIAGRGRWIREYGPDKEVRKLRPTDIYEVINKQPKTAIVNNKKEWEYWYFKLCIGKLHRVMVSEACMLDCLGTCLDEVIIKKDELIKCDGEDDIMFLGVKKKASNRKQLII